MVRKKRMATLWEVPDDLWERISQLLDEYDPPKATGRKREDARKILDGLIFRFRTGCQWNQIPSLYGDDSTLHRTFQRWEQIGLFEKIWSLLIEECDELGQVEMKKHPARRWVVERTLAWLSKCRGLLVRYEKKSRNYLALLQFACALLWYRRLAYASF